MYIPKTLHEENVHNNCLMGLIFWTSWGPDQEKSKTPLSHDFWKNVPKVSVSGCSFEQKGLVLHVLCLSLSNLHLVARRRLPTSCCAKPQAGRRCWGTRYDSSKLIVSESESESEKWKVKSESEVKWVK